MVTGEREVLASRDVPGRRSASRAARASDGRFSQAGVPAERFGWSGRQDAMLVFDDADLDAAPKAREGRDPRGAVCMTEELSIES